MAGFCKLTTSLIGTLKVNESRGLDSGKGMALTSPKNATMVKLQCIVKITPSNFFRASLHLFPPSLCSLVTLNCTSKTMFLEDLKSDL